MLSKELDNTAVKSFMGKILKEAIFDDFDVRTVDIFAQMRINLECAKEEGFLSWSQVRPLVYEIIKASPKPKHIKIVLSYSQPLNIHPNAAVAFLNIVYENDGVIFTTATAQKEFALDKAHDSAWDEYITSFFVTNSLVVSDRE